MSEKVQHKIECQNCHRFSMTLTVDELPYYKELERKAALLAVLSALPAGSEIERRWTIEHSYAWTIRPHDRNAVFADNLEDAISQLFCKS